MRLVFTPNGWQDCTHWVTTDRATLKRLNRLIDDVLHDPFSGIGKPEPLRHAFAGCWSRRRARRHQQPPLQQLGVTGLGLIELDVLGDGQQVHRRLGKGGHGRLLTLEKPIRHGTRTVQV
ncbi:MAG: Txe/YoeB family addiction module toxin [Pseudonocardiaceae bacterium]|nr:Txe/YoeB family addiction module toxin [Pseudonocardiaceae bacterium]